MQYIHTFRKFSLKSDNNVNISRAFFQNVVMSYTTGNCFSLDLYLINIVKNKSRYHLIALPITVYTYSQKALVLNIY